MAQRPAAYVIARSRSGRAMLQHAVEGNGDFTLCGVDMRGTSRKYISVCFDPILCKRCAHNLGYTLKLDN